MVYIYIYIYISFKYETNDLFLPSLYFNPLPSLLLYLEVQYFFYFFFTDQHVLTRYILRLVWSLFNCHPKRINTTRWSSFWGKNKININKIQ